MFPVFTNMRFNLSAEPTPNGYHELWSQYFMLDQGAALGKSYAAFLKDRFVVMPPPIFKTKIIPGKDREIEGLIAPMTYRLKASDYLNMPDVIYNTIKVELPEDLHSQYRDLENEMFAKFDWGTITVLNAMAVSTKYRQFIQGAIYTENPKYQRIHNIKLEALEELVEGLNGDPLICTIQFRFEITLIQQFFKGRLEVPVIAGGVPDGVANLVLRNFNAGKYPLMLVHPASLSAGVNLQAVCHNICWYARTWSCEQYSQLNGRINRQGQMKPVFIHDIVMLRTIDLAMKRAVANKEKVQLGLLNALSEYQKEREYE
jgi:SNF2 family DNA or RNA helicase